MKAALLKEIGKLTLEDIPTPPCPKGGLLVKVRACSICSSDAKMFYKGHPALVHPRIMGHEVSGEVLESRTPQFRAGDRVQLFPGICCGTCPACRRGDDNHCHKISIMGFGWDGAFAEYIAILPKSISSGAVNLIPDGVNYEEAALAEPLASCLNGQELIHVSEDDIVLIVGAGPIGLLHARLARVNGASKVIVADTLPSRLSSANRESIDRIIDVSTEDIAFAISQETRGTGVDVIFTATSSAEISNLLGLLAPRGRLCLFSGLPKEKSLASFDGNLVHYRELAIVGAYGSTIRQNAEALRLIASHAVTVKDLITTRLRLEKINEGLEYVRECSGLKTVIVFD